MGAGDDHARQDLTEKRAAGRARTALVTGASAGIGAAIAGEYARRGVHLVLSARRADRLQALAARLQREHGVKVQVLVADLADPGAPQRIAAELQARAVQVDILVNNAGYGVPGLYLHSPWAVHAAFLQVMVTAVAELTHRLAPGMRARGYGRVLNVASLAGHVPATPGHTLYVPVKAWMVRFSEALAFELAGDGIRVCALCPGFTWSEFHDVAGTRAQVARLPGFMWQSAELVARQGIEALERGQVVHITGAVNRFIALSVRVLPRALVYRVLRAQAHRFRRTD